METSSHPYLTLTPPKPISEPPRWLLIACGTGALVALMIVAFLPGSTLLDRLRALTGGICAQLPTHSYYPGGERLPLCARNTGIYLGVSLGTILLFLRGRGRAMLLPRGWTAVFLILAVMMLGIDGMNSLLRDLQLPHLYQPSNPLRLATGLLTGTAIASYLVPVVNSIIWQQADKRRAYHSVRDMLPVIPLLVLAFLAVISQASFLLYPLALLSAGGVVFTLTLINLTFIIAFTGKTERYMRYAQVVPLFSLATILAVSELMGLFTVTQAMLHALPI